MLLCQDHEASQNLKRRFIHQAAALSFASTITHYTLQFESIFMNDEHPRHGVCLYDLDALPDDVRDDVPDGDDVTNDAFYVFPYDGGVYASDKEIG